MANSISEEVLLIIKRFSKYLHLLHQGLDQGGVLSKGASTLFFHNFKLN